MLSKGFLSAGDTLFKNNGCKYSDTRLRVVFAFNFVSVNVAIILIIVF